MSEPGSVSYLYTSLIESSAGWNVSNNHRPQKQNKTKTQDVTIPCIKAHKFHIAL